MLNQAMEQSLSKLMTKILRHTPEQFGVSLHPEDGSCGIQVLLEAIQAQSKWAGITIEDIEQVVRNSEKRALPSRTGVFGQDMGIVTIEFNIRRANRRLFSITGRTKKPCPPS